MHIFTKESAVSHCNVHSTVGWTLESNFFRGLAKPDSHGTWKPDSDTLTLMEAPRRLSRILSSGRQLVGRRRMEAIVWKPVWRPGEVWNMEARVPSAGLSWKSVRRPEKHGRRSSVGWTHESQSSDLGLSWNPTRRSELNRSQSSDGRSRIEARV